MKEILARLVEKGREDLVTPFTQIYKTIATNSGFLYYSCPISTGSELLKKTLEGKPFDIQEIIDKNCMKAEECVTDLRWSTTIPIISPAVIKMTGWTQEDYCLFWKLVIERFVNTTFFGNEWYYSRGCCYEYLVCLDNDIPRICNIKKKDITTAEALEKITKAITEYEKAGLDTGWHKAIYDGIKSYEASSK